MTRSEGFPDGGGGDVARLWQRSVVRAEGVMGFLFQKCMVHLSLWGALSITMSVLIKCKSYGMMVVIHGDQWSRPNPGCGHGSDWGSGCVV